MNSNTKELLKKCILLAMSLVGLLAFILPIAAIGEEGIRYAYPDINGFKLISLLLEKDLIFLHRTKMSDVERIIFGFLNVIMLLATLAAIYFAVLNIVGKRGRTHTVKIVMIISFSVAVLCLFEWLMARFVWLSKAKWYTTIYADGRRMPGYKSYVPWIFLLDLILAIAYMIFDGAFERKKDSLKSNKSNQVEGYYSLGKHIIFSLIFPIIWTYIWIYRTTKVLNKAKEGVYCDPLKKLLLCIFIPFYQIYWFYKQGQKLDVWAKEKNPYASDKATLCLIFAIFIPFIASVIMQDGINATCALTNIKTVIPEVAKVSNIGAQVNSIPEQLKEYKELFDSGIITEEEFEKKKKQLLGI